MARRLIGLVSAAAVVLLAAACDQAPPSAPQDNPSFAKTPSPDFGCIFTGNPSVSNSAGSYFVTNADRKAAADWITAMQAGYTASGPAGARDAGYSLLALTGTASRDPSRAGNIDIGETMVKLAVNCMYDTKNTTDFSGWPTDGQYDFSAALDAPNGGAFFVRGGTDDPAGPVIGNIASLNSTTDAAGGNVSGMAPPTGKTWPDILVNNAQKRFLIYGEPVAGGFDWKLIGRNTTFSPFVLVALCQAARPGQPFDAADVVFQQDVGSLGVQPEAICGTLPSSFALGGSGGGAFGLVSRFVAMAGRMLTPEPLHATALATTIGGSASGAKKDQFTVLNLPTVNLQFTVQPPKRPKVGQRFPITVNVTTPAGNPAGGITVTLGTTTNNGTGTSILEITSDAPASYTGCSLNDNPTTGPAWVVTPSKTTLGTVGVAGTSQPTEAKWDKVCFTKTGNVQIVATSQAAGNTAAGNATKLSNPSNVDP